MGEEEEAPALKSVERGRRRAAIQSRQTGQEDNLDGKTDEHGDKSKIKSFGKRRK